MHLLKQQLGLSSARKILCCFFVTRTLFCGPVFWQRLSSLNTTPWCFTPPVSALLPYSLSVSQFANSLACYLPKELHMAARKAALHVLKTLSQMGNGLSLCVWLSLSSLPHWTDSSHWIRKGKEDVCCKCVQSGRHVVEWAEKSCSRASCPSGQ